MSCLLGSLNDGINHHVSAATAQKYINFKSMRGERLQRFTSGRKIENTSSLRFPFSRLLLDAPIILCKLVQKYLPKNALKSFTRARRFKEIQERSHPLLIYRNDATFRPCARQKNRNARQAASTVSIGDTRRKRFAPKMKVMN